MATYDNAGRDRITPDPVLTNMSVEFERNAGEFISNIIFPTVRVTLQSGRYRVYGRESFRLNFGGDVRAPGTRANEIEGFTQWSEDTFFATEHALEIPVPDEERENNPDENVDADATEEVTSKLLLGKELAAVNLVTDATQYRASHVTTLGAGQHFDEYGTSDPITVFRDAFRTFHGSTGTVPNVAVIPWTVMSYLEDHPDVIARYQAQGGVITAEQIAALFGVQRIVVPGAAYNENANPGVTASIAEIWGDNILLAYVPNRPSLRTPALGYEFLWPISRGRRGPDNTTLDTRRDDDNIRDIHRARRRYDLKLVGKDPDLAGTPVIAGYLIQNVLLSQ